MNRREFFRAGGLAALSVTFMGISPFKGGDKTEGACATSKDILGPYFREGAPWRENLCPPQGGGIPLEISGCVYGPDCETPIPNAVVNLWNCDHEGNYDNDSDEFRYRGQLKTDKQGKYRFQTILPGRYPLTADQFRPSHLHFYLSHPDHADLITQVYFEGDPWNKKDPWASKQNAARRILDLRGDETKGYRVQFDIFLRTA